MRPVIMHFDVIKIGCVLESGVVPIQLAQPQVNRWITVADRAEVALEVAEVDGVEADLHTRTISGLVYRDRQTLD